MNLATCVVSCDSGYLREYLPSFAMSCNMAGNPLHCHIVNATEEDLSFTLELADKLKVKVGATFERGSPEDRVYYACNRFLIAPELLKYYPGGIMICDIDAIVMRSIPAYDVDIGLYLRDPIPNLNSWETEGTRVNAGAVYLNGDGAKDFAQKVYEILLSSDGHLQWFSDQVALHRAYQEHKDSLKFMDLSGGFMSWESSENCYLFSAKGNRKHTLGEYINLKSKLEQSLAELSMR